MGGMPATAQVMQAYTEAKTQGPKALADAEALVAKSQAMSATLAKHNITLKVTAPLAKSTTSAQGPR
jgi:hypothetical protein